MASSGPPVGHSGEHHWTPPWGFWCSVADLWPHVGIVWWLLICIAIRTVRLGSLGAIRVALFLVAEAKAGARTKTEGDEPKKKTHADLSLLIETNIERLAKAHFSKIRTRERPETLACKPQWPCEV